MKLPGPEHPIAIARNSSRVRVVFAAETIADTTRALTLREAGYAPVHYIPRAAVHCLEIMKKNNRLRLVKDNGPTLR